jgi:dephospho-CoA kinase
MTTNYPYTVGLTGGIGSGKTTVANVFSDLGIEVIDVDQGSRAVVEPGSHALNTIADHFANTDWKNIEIVVNNQLNRGALREIIFADSREKEWLEQLLHPLIRDWVIDRLLQAKDSAYIILESPLLIETDQYKLVDTVLVVDVPETLQLQRASLRDGMKRENIQAIMDTQMSREQRLAAADLVFDNSLSSDSLVSRVNELHQQFLKNIKI